MVLDSNFAGRVYAHTVNSGQFQEWHATGSLARWVNVG
jgi:hypothetical protein